MRKVLIAGSVLLLSACNMVVSKEPWFTPADAAQAPQLRSGMWVIMRKADCQFDPAAEARTWPECASPLLIKADRISGPRGEEEERSSDPATWDSVRYLLVDGRPMIEQIEMGETAKPGEPPKESDRGYLYMGLEPGTRDDQGRIITARMWPVVCGPLPAKGKAKGKLASVTDKPFKGLKVDGMACAARDVAALRNAAAQSGAMLKSGGKSAMILRWLKD